MEKEIRAARLWHTGALFIMTLFMCLLLNTGMASAAQIPEGSYPTDNTSPLTYTFTGDATAPHGFVANVESYRSNAIVNGVLTIPETIKYKRPEQTDEEAIDVEVRGVLRGVFKSCTSLTKLILPNTLTYIGQEAFSECTNMVSIQTLGSTLNGYITANEIGYRAFYGCTSLAAVHLGEKNGSHLSGVQTVQNEAFMNCSQLTSLEIGPTVSWIEGGAFANCTALNGAATGIKVRDNQLFFMHNGILYFKESNRSNVLLLCPAGTPIGVVETFPDNVTQIKAQAFYGCMGLSSITIPNTVKSIGNMAFYNCIGLGNVSIPASVISIGSQAFVNCSNGLCIICASGSPAESYAITNGIARSAECTITFYNTYTRESTTRTVASGQTVYPPMGWEREGYVLHWSDNFSSNTIVTANRTISTVWKKLYTVTFRDDYSGNVSVVENVEEGTEAAPPNWTRKGYTLAWSSENYKMVNSDLTITASWLVSITDPPEGDGNTYKKGDLVTLDNILYKITSYNQKRVRVMGLDDDTVSLVRIPNTVSFGGRTYQVTCINANAFRNNQHISKVVLGTYMRSVEHYAFYNCQNLTRVVIKSRVLVNFSNCAFKKTLKTLRVYVPTNSLISTYRAGMLDAGLSKKATVKKIVS